jgi:hypothetical protein
MERRWNMPKQIKDVIQEWRGCLETLIDLEGKVESAKDRTLFNASIHVDSQSDNEHLSFVCFNRDVFGGQLGDKSFLLAAEIERRRIGDASPLLEIKKRFDHRWKQLPPRECVFDYLRVLIGMMEGGVGKMRPPMENGDIKRIVNPHRHRTAGIVVDATLAAAEKLVDRLELSLHAESLEAEAQTRINPAFIDVACTAGPKATIALAWDGEQTQMGPYANIQCPIHPLDPACTMMVPVPPDTAEAVEKLMGLTYSDWRIKTPNWHTVRSWIGAGRWSGADLDRMTIEDIRQELNAKHLVRLPLGTKAETTTSTFSSFDPAGLLMGNQGPAKATLIPHAAAFGMLGIKDKSDREASDIMASIRMIAGDTLICEKLGNKYGYDLESWTKIVKLVKKRGVDAYLCQDNPTEVEERKAQVRAEKSRGMVR